jgi:hypothetical protein
MATRSCLAGCGFEELLVDHATSWLTISQTYPPAWWEET